MAREFFENLPNTTTPLTAPRINDLLDGDEAMGNIVVDSIQTKNMIGGWFYGGISASDGSDSSSTNARRTDYIEVDFSKFSQYKMSGMPVQKCSWFVAAYNSSKQFLGRTGAVVQTGQTSITLNTTSFSNGTAQGTGDIKYLRVTLYSPVSGYTIDQIISDYSTIQLETGGSETDYSEYKGIGYLSGSNENGNYIKYDDGTLIQWGEITATTGTNSTSLGGCTIYTSDEVFQYFPISFINNNVTVCTQINGGTGYLNFIYTVIAAARVRITLASTSSNLTRTIRWLAIGRWK